jgi:transposase
MPAPYSYDLRKKAIEAVKRGQRKTDVCPLLQISRNTLDLWLKREKETGDYSVIANVNKGRKTKIKDEDKFRKFIREHSDKTQNRMAELWGENLTQPNISYCCQKIGITRKKTYGYQERNEEEREELRQKLRQIGEQRKVYLDEAGFDNREDYDYGYSPRGERCYALKCGKKRERTSWISALKEGKIFAPLTIEGSCNRDLFEAWLAKSLIPKLNPGDIIILDNASFHRETIREIVEEAGCELWYLPAYSPDLNKIENWWAVLKTWMKQRLNEFESVQDCVDAAFKNCPNVFA